MPTRPSQSFGHADPQAEYSQLKWYSIRKQRSCGVSNHCRRAIRRTWNLPVGGTRSRSPRSLARTAEEV